MFDRFFDSTKAQYIARPEAMAGDLVFLHPDKNVPRRAKLTVRADEVAVFFREGRPVGVLQAGAYVLDTQNIPFLGQLVNVVTGGNHYLAELFFVRTAETPIGVGASELGSFVDVNSRNLLRLLFDARVTVTVNDPLALITQLGGQSAASGDMVMEIVSGRLRNALKALVAAEAQRSPIYHIISNAGGEEFGRAVVERIAPEFTRLGLQFVRFLDLHVNLDDESAELLRDYQRREADLVIDAKGAQVASDPGFAVYNAVKGGRSMAEGLGTGLSQGFSGPVIGMGLGGGAIPGFGLGGSAVGRPSGSAPAPMPAPRAGVPRAIERFFVRGAGAGEGPYSARQVVLWAIGGGRNIESLEVRLESDPPEMWSAAINETSIAAEWTRRRGNAVASSNATPNSPFEALLSQALSDNRLTVDELSLLASMAVQARLAGTDQEARVLIRKRAIAAGCLIEEPANLSYSYYDGSTQHQGLSARDVMLRIQNAPGAAHHVWTPELGNWVDPRSVPEIASLISRAPPPPPPPPSVTPPAPPS